MPPERVSPKRGNTHWLRGEAVKDCAFFGCLS